MPVFRDGVEVSLDKRSLNEPVDSLACDEDDDVGVLSLEFCICAAMPLTGKGQDKRGRGEDVVGTKSDTGPWSLDNETIRTCSVIKRAAGSKTRASSTETNVY